MVGIPEHMINKFTTATTTSVLSFDDMRCVYVVYVVLFAGVISTYQAGIPLQTIRPLPAEEMNFPTNNTTRYPSYLVRYII